MQWPIAAAVAIGFVSICAGSDDPTYLSAAVAVVAASLSVCLAFRRPKDVSSAAMRLVGVVVAVVLLAGPRLEPWVSAYGTTGPGPREFAEALSIASLWAVPRLSSRWWGVASTSICGVAFAVICARAYDGRAIGHADALTALPSVEVARWDVGPSAGEMVGETVADGSPLEVHRSYRGALFCEGTVAKHCATLPVWNHEPPHHAIVRVAWTPDTWFVSSQAGPTQMLFAVDRSTMAAVPLVGARLADRPISAPRSWTIVACAGLVMALGCVVVALVRAHRSSWVRHALPGQLGDDGLLTVGDHVARFGGGVRAGPVSVRAVDARGGSYRDATATDVVEGHPAQAREAWQSRLLGDLAGAALVALLTLAPLAGAGAARISAARLW